MNTKDFRFKIDMRKIEIQQRQVRDGNAMLFQSRNIAHHPSGKKDIGEWRTISTLANYGDCFDEKRSLLDRFFDWAAGK